MAQVAFNGAYIRSKLSCRRAGMKYLPAIASDLALIHSNLANHVK